MGAAQSNTNWTVKPSEGHTRSTYSNESAVYTISEKGQFPESVTINDVTPVLVLQNGKLAQKPDPEELGVWNPEFTQEDSAVASQTSSELQDEHEKDDISVKEPKTRKQLAKTIISIIFKLIGIIVLLYFFICSLDMLSSGFILVGGRYIGETFNSPLLTNPVCGLVIGIVFTAFVQSSSTSTSIVVTLVSSGLITVQVGIPIIMGANIGTSVTGILVSAGQVSDRPMFGRATSCATCNDMFNWLTVFILLPLEVATGYLYHLSKAMVDSTNLSGGADSPDFLKAITKPFTNLIVQIDKSLLDDIAAGKPGTEDRSFLKYWCKYISVPDYGNYTTEEYNTTMPSVSDAMSTTASDMNGTTPQPTMMIGVEECRYLFHGTSLSDEAVGGIVLVWAFVMLMLCLILMVKILKSMLAGALSKSIKKAINSSFPGKVGRYFTGYVVILVGCGVTVLVQSSSIVVSAVTPLVGLEVVTLDRVLPILLGANIGTTSTALLAAFAADSSTIGASLQLAFCHMFFNITGIAIWYAVPFMRKAPLGAARFLGKTMARYRWFTIVYALGMFFIFPGIVLGLSIPGWQVLLGVLGPVVAVCIAVGVTNCIQRHNPECMHPKVRTWNFLPEWMRSLAPLDRQITRCTRNCKCKCCQPQVTDEDDESSDPGDDTNTDIALVIHKLDMKGGGSELKPPPDSDYGSAPATEAVSRASSVCSVDSQKDLKL